MALVPILCKYNTPSLYNISISDFYGYIISYIIYALEFKNTSSFIYLESIDISYLILFLIYTFYYVFQYTNNLFLIYMMFYF